MKLTRYEYKHNPDGKREVNRISDYYPPLLRLIIICVSYAVVIYIGLDMFIFKKFNIVASIFEIVVVILFSAFAIEHDPLFIVSFLIRALYYIFSKNSVHKKLVRYLLKDYRNVISIENKLNISNVKISFFNPSKIIYYKNGKRGSVSPKYVKLEGEILLNEYSNCENEYDYIKYLKITIKEIYKNFKEKKNSK